MIPGDIKNYINYIPPTDGRGTVMAYIAGLQRRIDDLLEANNRYLERARAAEAKNET